MIECFKSPTPSKFLTERGHIALKKIVDKYNPGEFFYLEEVDIKKREKEEYSRTQQNYYFSVIIPILVYSVDEFGHFYGNRIDKDGAHFQLKTWFCTEVRTDMFIDTQIINRETGKKETIKLPFTAKLTELSQKKATQFFDYAKNIVMSNLSLEWEQVILYALDERIIKKKDTEINI